MSSKCAQKPLCSSDCSVLSGNNTHSFSKLSSSMDDLLIYWSAVMKNDCAIPGLFAIATSVLFHVALIRCQCSDCQLFDPYTEHGYALVYYLSLIDHIDPLLEEKI